jgi:Predicted membrane protein (DUF2142)
VSKRSATRTPSPAPEKGRSKSPGGNGVGTRAFRRRAQATQRKHGARSAATPGNSLAGYAARLPEIDFRGLLRRIPRAALICALVACLNAACWSIITPAFQVPDETAHFAYVKQLAETGSLPTSSSIEGLSAEEISVLDALRYYKVRQQPQNHTIASATELSQFKNEMSVVPKDKGSNSAGVATSQPPLYYALQTIPYTLAGKSLLGRLQLMRLFSALFAGLTALFAYMFIREALPSEPWAWAVGGLSVALAPLLGFISGAVNPDAMLFAVSALTFYLLARAFRRGLTMPLAGAIGVVMAIGLVTKLNFVGLVPGILLGLVIVSARVARDSRRSAVRMLALAAGIGLLPGVLVLLVDSLSHGVLLGQISGTVATGKGSFLGELNYIWQLYLPRLPGTVSDFPGLLTARQFWFNGYVGLYGYLDTTFPSWVYDAALVPAAALLLLCCRSLLAARAELRSRAAEFVTYAVITLGVLTMIGASSYRLFPGIDAEYTEVRYLFPMLALLGVLLALAARGAGRRWGPVVGVVIVILFLAHDVFSQMLVVGRFYG